MKRTKTRIWCVIVVICLCYGLVGGRLTTLTLLRGAAPTTVTVQQAEQVEGVDVTDAMVTNRAVITDRNGTPLAMTLNRKALYADPSKVLDAADAAVKLAAVLPDRSAAQLEKALSRKGRFVWLHRNLTPQQAYAVNRLGLPGLEFRDEIKRVYPHGGLFAHVLGYTNVDNRGIAGLEQEFDATLANAEAPLTTSLDARVQHILQKELSQAIAKFNAIGGGGLVMDVRSGELLALVSLPDYDPNDLKAVTRDDAKFNRITKGVYEMGSTFKIFTTAAALDTKTAQLYERHATTTPLKYGRFTIRDYKPKRYPLSTAEVFIHSSNIGSALMAEEMGTETMRDYFNRFGLLEKSPIELPEVGSPLVPERWREVNTATASYGHGIAVSPLQLSSGVAAVVNGGYQVQPTLLKGKAPQETAAVLNPGTAEIINSLLRLTVTDGTGSKADVDGFRVGGKTGSAEKSVAGGYHEDALLSSFVGVYPTDAPRYLVFAMLDEPKGRKDTFGYATGGWTAAPVVGAVIAQSAPLLSIDYQETEDLPALRTAMGLPSKEQEAIYASY